MKLARKRTQRSTIFGKVQYLTLPQNLLTVPETLIEDFETFAQWTLGGSGAIEDNATEFVSGAHSLKLLPNTGTSCRGLKTVNLNLSTPQTFLLRFYPHATIDNYSTSPVGLQFQGAGTTIYYNASQPVNRYQRWNIAEFSKGYFTIPSGSWNNTILTLRVDAFSATSKTAQTSVDRLTSCTGTPAVFISFDDEYMGMYEKAFPYMRARGIKGTMYVNKSNVGQPGYMTSAQLQELYAAGWDIANHTVNHINMATQTQQAIEAELSECKSYLDGLGMTRASMHVAYPNNAIDDEGYAAMAATGMLTGRAGSRQNWIVPSLDLYNIAAYTMRLKTPTQLKADIDNCITNKQVAAFYWHNIVDSIGDAAVDDLASDFYEIIDYIVAQKIQPLTISEIYASTQGAVTVTVPKSF